eukprot:5742277-Amphidinium_carterae.1
MSAATLPAMWMARSSRSLSSTEMACSARRLWSSQARKALSSSSLEYGTSCNGSCGYWCTSSNILAFGYPKLLQKQPGKPHVLSQTFGSRQTQCALRTTLYNLRTTQHPDAKATRLAAKLSCAFAL